MQLTTTSFMITLKILLGCAVMCSYTNPKKIEAQRDIKYISLVGWPAPIICPCWHKTSSWHQTDVICVNLRSAWAHDEVLSNLSLIRCTHSHHRMCIDKVKHFVHLGVNWCSFIFLLAEIAKRKPKFVIHINFWPVRNWCKHYKDLTKQDI